MTYFVFQCDRYGRNVFIFVDKGYIYKRGQNLDNNHIFPKIFGERIEC